MLNFMYMLIYVLRYYYANQPEKLVLFNKTVKKRSV